MLAILLGGTCTFEHRGKMSNSTPDIITNRASGCPTAMAIDLGYSNLLPFFQELTRGSNDLSADVGGV